MKALLLKETTGPKGFEIGEADEPTPAAGDVLIDVEAAGIAFPDLLISKGAYQHSPPMPFIAGQEVAGVVRSAPADARVKAGDRAWAASSVGGFAAVAAIDAKRVFPLADELDFVEGAALASNFSTAIFAFQTRGKLQAGETVLVLGAGGGLGSACVSVAKAMGARVIGNASSEAKADIARKAGADEVVLGNEWRDEVLALTEGGKGVDVVADIVGGDETLQAVRATAPEGRVIILGFTTGSIHEVKVNRLLLRNVSVVGAGLGAFSESKDPEIMAECGTELNRLIDGGMRPIVGSVYPIEEGAAALEQLDGRGALGKIVLTV
jgi:NADPH2:quinone reductase